MTHIVCTQCGRDLDPDAPGQRCRCRVAAPTRGAGRPRPTTFGAITQTAMALASAEGRAFTAADLELAARMHNTKVEA